MRTNLTVAVLFALGTTSTAFAGTYPVSGKWGQSSSSEKGPIDCAKLRVIAFNGDQRTDSKGGVPAYRNRTVTPAGASTYRVEDVFTTGQIASAHVRYTLRQIDADHLDMTMTPGGTVKLQKCK